MKSCLHYVLNLAVALGSTGILVGCGGGSGSSSDADGGTPAPGMARVTIMLASTDAKVADSDLAALPKVPGGNGGGPVDVSDILSLTVTVTQIDLQLCEERDDDVEVVEVNESSFDPTSVTIDEGETVRWEWQTDTFHTITSGAAGDPDAGSLFDEQGDTTGTVVELIFADEGIFPYFSDTPEDIVAGMAGVVVVGDDDADIVEARETEAAPRSHSGDDEGEIVTVFSGAADVDLIDLTALSQVLTSSDVPPGEYCRIRVFIEDPRLVLASDPETVITDVHLTANGRLFVKDEFELEEGVEVLIILDFGGIHLVKAGNSGQHVLTPQLRAEVQIIDAAVAFEGEIVAIDDSTGVIQVQTDTETLDVAVDGATVITSDDDADDAADTGTEVTLAFADLAVGQTVSVEGLLTIAGPIDANAILIADDDIVTNEIAIDGDIISVDAVNNVIQVQSGVETFDVAVGGGTTISTDDDADDGADTGAEVTLTFADLAVGQNVSVQGLVITGEPIDALTIEVADASIDTTI